MRIVGFLADIDIPVAVGTADAAGIVPGLHIHGGAIMIDPAVPVWPGDVLHEAGHIAVTSPERRAGLSTVSADPGEEMAAIAWSVAAARACEVPLSILFHDEGYKGDGAWLKEQFEQGQPFGVPLLAWYGMTEADAFPAMQRWLR